MTLPVHTLLSIMGVLYAVAVFQALLLTFYVFFQKKGEAGSRNIIGLLLVDFILFLSATFVLLFFPHWRYVYYAHLGSLCIFLAAPLLYFYVQSILNKKASTWIGMLYHGIPFLAIFTIMFYAIVVIRHRDFAFRPFGIVLIFALFCHGLFYLFRINAWSKGLFAKRNGNQSLRFAGYLWTGVVCIYIFKLVLFVIWNVLGYVDVCIYLTGIFFTLAFILINSLILYSLFHPEAMIHYLKYQSSGLSDDRKKRCFQQLVVLLEQKKLYTDPLLNLDKLARPLSISGKQLSQLINEVAGQNFNDFINRYRIAEAQAKIRGSADGQLNILRIAYDVGFNSKSTFNTAFKKFTNSTPSAYRKKS